MSSEREGTVPPHCACPAYNGIMRKLLLFLPLVLLLPAGCQKKPEIDYSPLDESGMWSTSLAEIKKMMVERQS